MVDVVGPVTGPVGLLPTKEKPGRPATTIAGGAPQDAVLATKKLDGKVIVMLVQSDCVVKANAAVPDDDPAMRLVQGMDNDTAVTCPVAAPMTPVGAYVVVQSLVVVTDTPH